jgi:probable addiction module antidote protein
MPNPKPPESQKPVQVGTGATATGAALVRTGRSAATADPVKAANAVSANSTFFIELTPIKDIPALPYGNGIRRKCCYLETTGTIKPFGGRMANPKDFRDNPAAIAEFLTEMFAKNDLPGILDALQLVMRAQNVKALSEATGMRRDGLYKVFGSHGDPRLSREC